MPGSTGTIRVLCIASLRERQKTWRNDSGKAVFRHVLIMPGLSKKVEENVQDEFIHDNVTIVCATIAFGLGIDKPDVRYVIHYDVPKSIESYFQETGPGRA